jgi:hypothetical protein
MARDVVIKGHSFKSVLLDGQRYVLEREVAPYIKEAGRTVRAKRPAQQPHTAIINGKKSWSVSAGCS